MWHLKKNRMSRFCFISGYIISRGYLSSTSVIVMHDAKVEEKQKKNLYRNSGIF